MLFIYCYCIADLVVNVLAVRVGLLGLFFCFLFFFNISDLNLVNNYCSGRFLMRRHLF